MQDMHATTRSVTLTHHPQPSTTQELMNVYKSFTAEFPVVTIEDPFDQVLSCSLRVPCVFPVAIFVVFNHSCCSYVVEIDVVRENKCCS